MSDAMTVSKGVDEKFCADCGAIINAKAEICPKCGVRQMTAPKQSFSTSSGEKDKTVAGLLAFFLGGLGIHKFYLGRNGKGVLYLLFCWTFIPALIAFFEAIGLFMMSEEKFQAKFFSE